MLKNFADKVKNFHNPYLIGVWGIGLCRGGEIGGGNFGFEIGASELFNNLTTSPLSFSVA